MYCLAANISITAYFPSTGEFDALYERNRPVVTISLQSALFRIVKLYTNNDLSAIISATLLNGVAEVIRTPYTSFPDGITDLNDFKLPTGVYVLSVAYKGNAPTGVGWCIFENLGNSGRRTQRIASMNSGEIYMRVLQLSSGVVSARPWKIVNTDAE